MRMLDMFPGESCVCLVFAARIGCTAFTAWDYGACSSLSFPGGNRLFSHHCATHLICSSNMETSVISRPEAGDWIPSLSGFDIHQKLSRNVKILYLFIFPPRRENKLL